MSYIPTNVGGESYTNKNNSDYLNQIQMKLTNKLEKNSINDEKHIIEQSKINTTYSDSIIKLNQIIDAHHLQIQKMEQTIDKLNKDLIAQSLKNDERFLNNGNILEKIDKKLLECISEIKELKAHTKHNTQGIDFLKNVIKQKNI